MLDLILSVETFPFQSIAPFIAFGFAPLKSQSVSENCGGEKCTIAVVQNEKGSRFN